MAKRTKKSKKWIERLRNKYRLVLMHDKTFEIQASIKLSMLNVIILFSTLFVVMALVVWAAIVFTPLKNYVVGYSEVTTSRQVLRNSYVTDSILNELKAYDMYFDNLQKRVNGEIDSIVPIDSIRNKSYADVPLDSVSEMDQMLRNEVEQEDVFSINATDTKLTQAENLKSLYFFPPIKGAVTSSFDAKLNHYGVDVVANEDTPIKACLDGTVIDAYWNVESGNVIVIQHDHGLISFYKHNSVVLKKTGNFVKAGDVIAIIGNTGNLSSGPHLHFELWHQKIPVNPQEYINFN